MAVQFIALMEIEDSWLYNNILWSDEAHFYLHGTVNTHNCRMWDSQNPHAFQQIPLESSKPAVWCRFTASFVLVLHFCEENGVNAVHRDIGQCF
ncbi:hypothetical protein AVEN_158666-1 [Araneus ventricosus]|uniref:Uncharacterized protein n=1 Tax=Araneus ventricosus TaxID=182803 RepID=A0A4Y2U038_ARAVE|nr:hypothetical protein AVEN_224061-1 [Araneus ventricosus]GBO05557.1 hypothetical protein AVEN_158666-1 [Araneus ventricosus]